MPKVKLYNTKEERLVAHRITCKKSYEKHKAENAAVYRLRALRRYYSKKYEATHDQNDKTKLDQILNDLESLRKTPSSN